MGLRNSWLNTLLFLYLTLFPTIFTACNPADERAVTSSGDETKPIRTLLPDNFEALQQEKNTAVAEGENIITAVDYDVYVYSASSERRICLGTARINIFEDFNLNIPDGKIKCSSMILNLATLLSHAKKPTPEEKAQQKREHDGKMFYVGHFMGANFTPPRPLLIGPIITNSKKYEGYSKEVATTLNGTYDAKEYNSKGTFKVRVINHKTNYTNGIVGETFDNIINWELSASGFEGTPKGLGLIYKKITWWFNLKPIMIPKIEISGNISDFILSDDPNKKPDEFIGDVRVVLEVNNYSTK